MGGDRPSDRMTEIEITLTLDAEEQRYDDPPEELTERIRSWSVPTIGTALYNVSISDVKVNDD